MLIHTHQRQGFTGGRRATGTADTVDVIFRYVRQLVVHHVRQLFDIQTTGGDIGRHQHANAAGFKVGQRAGTRSLALVAMDRRAADAVFIKLLREVVGAMLGAGKHQHLLPVAFADQLRQQFALAALINEMDVLGDLLGRGVATRHFHFQRVVQQFLGQALDLVGEGGREQQVLSTRRQFSQYATDVMDKAHIQHAVRFVQHKDFHAIKADRVLMFEVQQTARGGNEDVDATAQLHHLRVDAHAAEYHQRANIQVLAVIADVLAHLRRQLTGRGQDQRAYRTATLCVRLFVNQALQQRQGKARRLTGTGLGAGHQVAPLHYCRDRLLLDRGRLNVALLSDSAQDIGIQAKGIKRHNNSEPPRPGEGRSFQGDYCDKRWQKPQCHEGAQSSRFCDRPHKICKRIPRLAGGHEKAAERAQRPGASWQSD